MSETMTIRLPRELKEKMKQNPVKWGEEVRKFIEERVSQLELLRALEEIESRAEKRKTRTDSAKLIREDRERQE
jgi:hypothetical protein